MSKASSGSTRKQRPSFVTGLGIVETLSRHPQGLGVTDVAKELELDPGHAHRLLASLVEGGWVTQPAPNGRYLLTEKLLVVAGNLLRTSDLREVAVPIMKEMAHESGETVHLFEWRRDSLVCVERQLSVQTVGVFTNVGDVVPLAGTAVGRAVLAALWTAGLADVDAMVKSEPGFPAEDALRMILERGYSIDDRVYRSEVRAVASPIWNLEARPVGSVGIVAPASRVTVDDAHKLGGLVNTAASRISAMLGFEGRWPGPTEP